MIFWPRRMQGASRPGGDVVRVEPSVTIEVAGAVWAVAGIGRAVGVGVQIASIGNEVGVAVGSVYGGEVLPGIAIEAAVCEAAE